MDRPTYTEGHIAVLAHQPAQLGAAATELLTWARTSAREDAQSASTLDFTPTESLLLLTAYRAGVLTVPKELKTAFDDAFRSPGHDFSQELSQQIRDNTALEVSKRGIQAATPKTGWQKARTWAARLVTGAVVGEGLLTARDASQAFNDAVQTSKDSTAALAPFVSTDSSTQQTLDQARATINAHMSNGTLTAGDSSAYDAAYAAHDTAHKALVGAQGANPQPDAAGAYKDSVLTQIQHQGQGLLNNAGPELALGVAVTAAAVAPKGFKWLGEHVVKPLVHRVTHLRSGHGESPDQSRAQTPGLR